jgi:hypothetical protein
MNLWYNLPGVYMEEFVFEILKNKRHFSPEDIHSLIVLCDRLFHRNKEIADELEKALGKIESLSNRVDFYRKTTMREIS